MGGFVKLIFKHGATISKHLMKIGTRLGFLKTGFDVLKTPVKGVVTWLSRFSANLASSAFMGSINLAVRGLSSLADAFVRILGLSSSLAGDREMQLTRFAVLLKDWEEAEKLMRQISKWGARTPFQVTEAREWFALMLQAGKPIGEIEGLLTSIGDSVAGDSVKMGRVVDNVFQIMQKGVADSVDFKQFANAGVDLKKVVAQLRGVKVEDLDVSKQPATADEIVQAFQKISGKGGLMEGAMRFGSATFKGSISNLMDTLESIGEIIGEPLNDTLKPFVKWLGTNIDTLRPTFKKFGVSLAQSLAVLIRMFTSFVSTGGLARILEKLPRYVLILALIIEDLFKWLTGSGASYFAKKFGGSWSKFISDTIRNAIDFLSATLGLTLLEVFDGLKITLPGGLEGTFKPDEGKKESLKQRANELLRDNQSLFNFGAVGTDSLSKEQYAGNTFIIEQRNNISTSQAADYLKTEIERGMKQLDSNFGVA